MTVQQPLVGLLGAGRQAIETAGYLQQAGIGVSFFFEEQAPAYDREVGEYEAPIVRSIDVYGAHADVQLLSAVGDPRLRQRLVGQFASSAFRSIVCAQSWQASNVTLGVDCTVAPFAAVNRWALVGDHVLINVGAIISHDVVIGNFATLGPGCRIGGACVIGAGAYVGLGATIRDHITIGDGAVVAAGAVVVEDVAAQTLVMGVPARSRRTTP